MATAKIIKGADNGSMEAIASNSLAIANLDMVSLVSGFVVKANSTTGRIIGFANGTRTYAVDNQTVAKAKVNYLVAEPSETVIELGTATATLTQAMVGSYFLLNASQLVDVTTNRAFKSSVNTSDAGVAADIVTDYQFQLVEFISSSKGRFMVV